MLRLSTACHRSTKANQNALSPRLRVAEESRRHSLALCWNTSVVVILASWMTPAALGMRLLSNSFRREFEGSRESLWQRNRACGSSMNSHLSRAILRIYRRDGAAAVSVKHHKRNQLSNRPFAVLMVSAALSARDRQCH